MGDGVKSMRTLLRLALILAAPRGVPSLPEKGDYYICPTLGRVDNDGNHLIKKTPARATISNRIHTIALVVNPSDVEPGDRVFWPENGNSGRAG